jgi:hypothetical protein
MTSTELRRLVDQHRPDPCIAEMVLRELAAGQRTIGYPVPKRTTDPESWRMENIRRRVNAA